MNPDEISKGVLVFKNSRILDILFLPLSMAVATFICYFVFPYFIDLSERVRIIIIILICLIQILFYLISFEQSQITFNKNSNLVSYESKKLLKKTKIQFPLKQIKKINYKHSVTDIFSNPGKVKPAERIELIFANEEKLEIARAWFVSNLPSKAKVLSEFLNVPLESRKLDVFEFMQEELFKK